MKSKKMIVDIQYLINEHYSDKEPLNESQQKSKKVFNDYCEQIKKELKALEIIKTKNVNIVELKMSSTVKQYNNAISFMMFYKKEYELTQEEFNLLKEVLKNGR